MDEALVLKNAEVLQELKHSSCRRRITKELETMYNIYTQINVKMNEKDRLEITVYEIDEQNKKQVYGFVMTNDYPFRPPIISYQRRPYIEYLITNQLYKSLHLVQKITGKSCFCCHSINCNDNWSPAITLSKIINEIRDIKAQKRIIINKLIADVIKKKYLIEDIDIDSWLF